MKDTYIQLTNREITTTVPVARNLHIDYDDAGRPVGIEVIGAEPLDVRVLDRSLSGTSDALDLTKAV